MPHSVYGWHCGFAIEVITNFSVKFRKNSKTLFFSGKVITLGTCNRNGHAGYGNASYDFALIVLNVDAMDVG